MERIMYQQPDYDVAECYEPLVYYHYCSLETFVKIIETSKIRLCNPYKMNDNKEVTWLFNRLTDVIQSIINDETNSEIKGFYQNYFNDLDKEYIREQCISTPYVTCFSEHGDILSQWRAYSDDGRGISIGFDINAIIQGSMGDLEFASICYNVDEQKKELGKIFLDYMKEILPNYECHSMSDLLIDYMNILEPIMMYAITCKNPAFKEECEGRLIFNTDICNNMTPEIKVSGPFFYSQRVDIQSYYDLDFSQMKNIINSIYIGPKSNVIERELKSFLAFSGYQVKEVNKSKASYR